MIEFNHPKLGLLPPSVRFARRGPSPLSILRRVVLPVFCMRRSLGPPVARTGGGGGEGDGGEGGGGRCNPTGTTPESSALLDQRV